MAKQKMYTVNDTHIAHMQRWADERELSKRERKQCIEFTMELLRITKKEQADG